MKLYLDTNIVTYFLYNRDELSLEVSELLFDYANILFTSSICVQELIHLTQIGKVQKVVNGKHKPIDPITVINTISDAGIDIVPVEERHLSQLASLPPEDACHDGKVNHSPDAVLATETAVAVHQCQHVRIYSTVATQHARQHGCDIEFTSATGATVRIENISSVHKV